MIARILTIPLVLLILAAMSASVSADGPVTQPSPSPLTAAQLLRAADKAQVAQKYLEVKRSGGSSVDFSGEIAALEARLNDGQPIPRRVNAQPDRVMSGEQGRIYPTWNLQEYWWWCGPANGWIAVNYMYDGLDSVNGDLLTQTSLSHSEWLNTQSNGTGLGWNWTHTLNAWRDGTDAGWWEIQGSPTAGQIGSFVSLDVDNFYVSVLDVKMSVSRGYLTGYTSAEGDTTTEHNIWHYVSATGYTGYGAVIGYLDTSSIGSPGYNTNNATFFATLTNGYGLIW
jgi:hypothetical protein